MHTADNQGYCWTCGIPMGVGDEEWEVITAMGRDERAKEHILIIARDVLGKADKSCKTK